MRKPLCTAAQLFWIVQSIYIGAKHICVKQCELCSSIATSTPDWDQKLMIILQLWLLLLASVTFLSSWSNCFEKMKLGWSVQGWCWSNTIWRSNWWGPRQELLELLLSLFANPLGQQHKVNIGQKTPSSNGDATKQLAQLLIIAPCQLDVAMYITGFFRFAMGGIIG